jgi:glutaredoxin
MVRNIVLFSAFALVYVSAFAQYKVIGPDGKITYTDQPPTDGKAKVQPFKAGTASSGDDVALPYATAQAARNFPVTLYTQDGCGPCDSGRTLLRARGVPFEEKTVSSNSDLAAFKAINKDGQLPVLSVGREQIAGYEASRWNSALSTAGYPANTLLPSGYAAKKSGLTQEASAAADSPTAAPTRPASRAPRPTPTPETTDGFKFQK